MSFGIALLVETVEHGAGDFDMHEWRSAAVSLQALGFVVRRFTSTEMLSGIVQLDRGAPVIGARRSLTFALRSLGVLGNEAPLPERQDYPESLAWFLGRQVWQSTLGSAMAAAGPTFVKPRGAAQVKRFTGMVVGNEDTWKLARQPSDLPVWCSEVLSFASEWRCYVLGDAVQCVCYKGDEKMAPVDESKIRTAIDCLRASGQGSAAYALDVGVVVTNGPPETVLIEVNDGFSLGLYPGCPESWYATMMVARWDEMVAG